MDLSGKVALVTGAVQGIGRAYVEALVNEGVKVSICDVQENEGKILENQMNSGGQKNSLFILCDVTNQTQFEDSFQQTIAEFGRLDIVVNNAGILDERPDTWEKEVQVNLCGVIRGSLLGLKYLKKGGIIVVTTSLAGIHRDSLFPVYSATKGGVNYFIRSLGSPHSSAETGIEIVGIAPGFTDTPILKQLNKNLTLYPGREESLKERMRTMYRQKPEVVAECLIDILKKGAPSGSIWVVDNDKWRLIDFSKLLNHD